MVKLKKLINEEYSDIKAGNTTKKDLIKDLPAELKKRIDPSLEMQSYKMQNQIKTVLKLWAIDVTKKELVDISKELLKTYDKWK
jgi:hypothetical protein